LKIIWSSFDGTRPPIKVSTWIINWNGTKEEGIGEEDGALASDAHAHAV